MRTQLVQIRADSYDSDTVAASGELDLGPYVNVGKRQVQGIWAFSPENASTDTDATYDNKFQESATTVDSDFGDITNGAFTQVTGSSTRAFQSISFTVTKRYIRAYPALGGTVAKGVDFTAVLLNPRFDT